ncbi:MAG: hypothetical protein KAR35_07075 [Candidatus Heimdallarchaeota archaeon]|nr:hypothetical protein [Candidatus Heimdallarchaeota archaeon]MCK5049121.1 hypothetical protein [Candidatus Heimdallarchaeota archaeon]
MSHDPEYSDELRESIAGTSSSPELLINQAIQARDAGNNKQAIKLFDEAAQAFNYAASGFRQQKRFRAASEASYQAYQAYQLANFTDKANEALFFLTEDLFSAAENYLTFGEHEKAMIPITISCYAFFLSGDIQKAKEIYVKYLPQIENIPGFGLNSLYSVGYFVEALTNVSSEAFFTAKEYVQGSLLPNLGVVQSDDFKRLIEEAVEIVSQLYRSNVKLPKISVETKIGADILFNESFEAVFEVVNDGEGPANQTELKLILPSEVEVLEGQLQVSLGEIEAEGRKEVKYLLRNQDADAEEATVELSGEVITTDILNNRNVSYFGPIEVTFRRTRLSEKYKEELDTSKEKLLTYEIKVKEVNYVSPKLYEQLLSSFRNLIAFVNVKIEGGAFEHARAGLDNLVIIRKAMDKLLLDDETVTSFKEWMTREKDQYANDKVTFERELLRDQHRDEMNNLKQQLLGEKAKELEDQKTTLFAEKQEALDEQRQILVTEKETAVSEHDAKLTFEHNEKIREMEGLKEADANNYQEELRSMQTEHSEQVSNLESRHSNTLAEKEAQFRQEVEKINNEHYTELQDLQTQVNKQKLELDEMRQRMNQPSE